MYETGPILPQQRLFMRKVRNWIDSALLIAGLLALMMGLGWLVAGDFGLFVLGTAGLMFLVTGVGVSPRLILRLYQAVPLSPSDAPVLWRILDELSARAGLPKVPALYYVPSPMMNAFTVGRKENAVIAVTDGLLRHLNARELAGVIAHEIGHIRNNDLWVMGIADLLSRLTRMATWLGQLLLLFNLPLVLLGVYTIPWWFILLLIFAPTLSALLQLALARTREYDADFEAALLTGDPAGLASALEKMEAYEARFWEQILFPGRRLPDPSLLRTHPKTRDRIRRLREIEAELFPQLQFSHEEHLGDDVDRMSVVPGRLPRPRWRISGLWY